MDWNERLDAMASGYQDAAILLAAIRHRLFDELDATPRSAADVASARRLDQRAVTLVLHALAGAGVLEKRDDGFVLPDDRGRILRSDGDDTQVSIFGHHEHLLKRWARLDEVLVSGQPIPRDQRSETELRDFICGMQDIQKRSLRGVLEVVDFADATHLLDLGGGPATAALAFAGRWPGLRCTVFDLPAPCAIARERIAAAGLEDRVDVLPGDYFVDDIGTGYDVIYLSNIIHSLAESETVALYVKCGEALVPGGRLLVKDFFLDDDLAHPHFAARFAVNMLVGTEGGRSYGESETREMMTVAGFESIERRDVPKHSALMIGMRAG